MALAEDRDWQPVEAEWRMLLTYGHGFGVDAPTGGLAGAVVVTCYGDELAAIGKLLVASAYGGRGLGRRLTEHVIAHAGGRTPILYATRYGRPLYLKLGFRDVDYVVRYSGEYRHSGGYRPPVPGLPEPRPVTDADLSAVSALDREATGADRSRLLEGVYGCAHRMVVIDGRGFAASWNGREMRQIGPVIARDEEAARALIHGLAAGATGPVMINLARREAGLAEWLTGYGLKQGAEFPLMVRGTEDPPGNRDRFYAPVTLAVG